MLQSAPVIGFVPTKDFALAQAFYVGILGLRLVAATDFALVLEGHGTTIRVTKVGDYTPFGFTILGWKVKNLPETVKALTDAGVKFLRYAWMEQSPEGIWTAPSGTLVAWFSDPDGNVLSLSTE